MSFIQDPKTLAMVAARDRTAQTEPLTEGQKIVAWWETSTTASEPADLADKIDDAIAEAFRRGQLSTLPT